jgi:histidine triad (HIT) family protein
VKECVFCKKIREEDLPRINNCVVFKPLNPVVEGHLLIVPIKHTEDFSEDFNVSADAMVVASMLARNTPECNVITSKGINATQTIKHLHLHFIPRKKDDGLKLPWSKSGKDMFQRS